MGTPKNPLLFFGGIAVAIIALAFSVYYLVPGVYHILSTHDLYSPQPTHALGFAAIAIISALAAAINRPRAGVNR